MKYLIKKPESFIDNLNEDINAILHKSFDSLFPEYLFQKESEGMAMPVDIKEFDDRFELKVELPGISKEDIDIDINKSYIKIEAKKESEKTEEDKKKKYHKSEFRYGQYCRTMYFPHEVNVSESKAELKHGVLRINLPKLQREEEKTSKIQITE